MTTLEYFKMTSPTRNVTLFDASPRDYIAETLRTAVTSYLTVSVARDKVGGVYLAMQTHILLFFLHKLHVRPST